MKAPTVGIAAHPGATSGADADTAATRPWDIVYVHEGNSRVAPNFYADSFSFNQDKGNGQKLLPLCCVMCQNRLTFCFKFYILIKLW